MTGHATSARQIGPVCHRHGPVRAVLAAGLLPVLLAAATAAGAADHFIVADDCHADYGELGNCTANEINIANASKAVTEAKFCIAGETVTIEQIDVTYGLNTGVRYDPLLWVGRTDNDPRGVAGTCFVSSVPPESGADYSIFRHLEGSEDPDLPPNDSCLDVSKPDPGDTVVNYATPFTVICTDSPDDEDNMADLQAVVTWLQNTNLVCGTDEGAGEDFAPGATSKCDWSLISLDIPVYPLGATLTLQKDVDNTGGGTAQDTDWTLAADGPVTVSGVEGEPEITAFKVPVGTYTLGESGGPAGYLAGDWSCTGGSLDGDQLTLAADDVAVCTITNTFITQSLSVTKNIVSDNGGGATLDDFDVEVDGVEVAWGSPGATGTGTELVTTDAGTYTLSESDLTGYAEGTWSCADQDLVTVPVTNGGAFGGSDVTVAAGQHVTCSITNDDIAPALTVIKHVINDDTGAAVAGDFTMMVTATNPSDAAFPGAEAPGTTITLDAGAYSVSETGPGGYVASYSAGCSGVLAVGETATCTVTNDDTDSPQLTVIVNVVTDNGGEAGPGEFTVEVTATNPSDDEFPGAASPGTTITLDPGDYDVGISGPSGYSPTLSAGCSGSLALGETATCTISMDDVAPELTIITEVVSDNGGDEEPGDFTVQVTATNPSDDEFPGAASPGTTITLDPGDYDVGISGPSGYSPTLSAGCSGSLALGETATCTISMDDVAPELTVIKQVLNDDDGSAVAGDFTMLVTATNPSDDEFPGAGPPGTTITLDAGAYSVDETGGPDGYLKFLGGGCAGVLGPGDQAECVITNNDLPLTSLSVTKVVISDQGGTATLGDFDIRVDGLEVSWPDPGSTTGGSAVVADSPASYDLSEADLAGYQEGTWSCTDQDLAGVPVTNGGAFGGASVSVAEGRQVICSITNDDEALEPETATLTLQKVVINDDGGDRAASEWTLTAAGPVTISGVTGDPSISGFDLPPGEYALSEAGPDDYESLGWTCSDGALAGNSLTLFGGENAVCTVVNDDIGPKPDIQVRQTVSGEQLDCPAVIGKPIEFFVIVENNGDGEAESVALDDEWTWQLKPARPKGAYECRPGKVQRTFECKLGNIGPGGSKDLGFRFSVGGQAGQYACNRASARTIPESPESGYNEFELCFRLSDKLRMHGELGIAQIGVPYEGFIDFSGGEPDHALDPLPLGLPNDLAAEVVGNRIRVAGCPKNDPDRILPSVSTVTLNLADDGACQVIEQDFLLGIENPPDCVLEDLVTIPVGQSGLPNPDTALPDESMQKVVVDSQRNRYLAGYTHIDQSYASDPNGAFLQDDLNYDIRLVKYRNRPDPDCLALGGSPDDCLVEWERRYDSGNDDLAYAVALNEQEGRIYLGGGSLLDTNAHSWWNAVLLEIDASTGCLIGSQAFSAGRGTTSFFYDIAVDDSRVYAVGERLFNPLRPGDAGALIGVFGQPAAFPSPPGQDCGDGDRIHIPTAQDGELDRAVFGQAELLHERIVTRGGAEPVVAYSVRPPLPDCESCEILVGGMSGTSGWIDTLDPADGTLVSFKSITDFSVLDIALFNESVIAVGSSPGDDMRLYVFDRPGPDAASRLVLDLGKGRLRGVTVDTNGYIYAAGKSNGNQGLIFKFDPDGGLIDRRELTGGSSLSFNDIAVFVPGTGTVAGHTEEAADGFGWLQVDFFCDDSCEGE